MNELGSSLPALAVILVLAVSGTVFLIQKLKMLVAAHFKGAWTQKRLKWFWLALSIALPFGLVLFMIQPWMQAWINGFLPESMRLAVSPQDVLGTGVASVFGSQGSYAVVKKLGLTGDYSAGGPNDITTRGVSGPAPEVTPEVPNVPPESTPITGGVIPESTPFPEPVNVPKQETPVFAHLLAYCSSEPDLVLIDGDPPIVVPVKSEEMRAWATSPPKT